MTKKNARIDSNYRPKNSMPSFLKVLEGWRCVPLPLPKVHGFAAHDMQMTLIVSPDLKVYREAASWENPTLVIHADILAPAYHLRLVRIRDKAIRVSAKRAYKKIQRGGLAHAVHRD